MQLTILIMTLSIVCCQLSIQNVEIRISNTCSTKNKVMILKIIGGLLILILIVLVWIIFVPVSVYIDTATNRYEVFQAGTFSASLVWENEPGVNLKIVGLPINTSKKSMIAQASPEKKEVKRKSQKSPEAMWFLIKGIAKSISLRKLVLDFDPGDVVLNAQLVPLLTQAQTKSIRIATNFNGQLYAHVEMEAYLYKMLWTFIQFLTKK